MKLVAAAWNFICPQVCVACGGQVPSGRAVVFCGQCLANLVPANTARCYRCAAPVGPHLNTLHGCALCREDRFAFERVFSLGAYDGELRSACITAKDPFRGPLAAGLAQLTFEQHGTELRDLHLHCAIPIPHHWAERLWRSQLPPVTLAETWGRLLGLPVPRHVLLKRRRTPAQASLTPTARRENLKHAFHIGGQARLDGLRVLLVDDVLTTGTTAHRAARLLREAGAEQVYVVVVARGIGTQRLSSR